MFVSILEEQWKCWKGTIIFCQRCNSKTYPKVKLIPIYQVILGGSGLKNCHPRLSVYVLDETVKV
jgi:hypothetical protein